MSITVRTAQGWPDTHHREADDYDIADGYLHIYAPGVDYDERRLVGSYAPHGWAVVIIEVAQDDANRPEGTA